MLLSLSGISKSFGTRNALADVSLSVAAGEVHALLGENGAGKTTLMRIAGGHLAADSGAVTVDSSNAIGMVHQHFTSIAAFTVAENIALSAGWRDTGPAAVRRAGILIAGLGLAIDPRAFVSDLTVQLRQRLEVIKALATDAKILLLDEPTAVLAPREVRELMTLIRNFAEQGGAVLLITHKLHEAIEVADRVTVLRQGRVALTGAITTETTMTLARAIMGADNALRTTLPIESPAVARPEPVVTLAGRDGPIQLHAGEIIGLAAIEGNSQQPLLRAVAGLTTSPLFGSVRGAVGFVPEDRTTEALIPAFSLTENLVLAELPMADHWINWKAMAQRSQKLIAEWDIKTTGPEALVSSLSGGNQQRFVLARVMAANPQILVAEDPTRGLDLQATAYVHDRLRAAAAAGACVLLHAADLDEVLSLANRILVMAAGTLSEMPADATRDAIGDAMLGIVPVST
jgi:simple sugar transport system ATP-binding protein